MLNFNQLFNDSFERASVHSDEFYEAFYTCFMNKSEVIDAAFSGVDMQRQKKMLKESILFMISFSSTRVAEEFLLNTAKVHKDRLDLTDEMYALWMESLMETLQQFDRKFNAKTELAWRIMLAPGIEFMKFYPKL